MSTEPLSSTVGEAAPPAAALAAPTVVTTGANHLLLGVLAIVALAALGSSAMLWQRLSNIQEQLRARAPTRAHRPPRHAPWHARHRIWRATRARA